MTAFRLFSANGPANASVDAADYTLGVEFFVTSACDLTAYFFWHPADAGTGDKLLRLYEVLGATTGNAVPGSDIQTGTTWATGWNRFPLPAPIALTPNQRYRAVINFTDANGYSSVANYWSSGAGSAGIVNGPLNAPNAAGAIGGDQGSFRQQTAIAFPTDSFNSTNYGIDVEVDDGEGGATPSWAVGAVLL